MEPVDLKTSSPENDPVDAWLRANSNATPLPDAGFTDRVLASLPASTATSAKPAASRRAVFCLVGAFAGLVLPWLTGTRLPEVIANAAELNRLAQPALQQFTDPNLALALVVTAASLLYVFGPRGRKLVR